MKYLINLFPEKEKTLSDNLIYFAFHYLRYILVITQFIAICVFFFRFKVDQEIVDLREKLGQKQSIVEATGDLIHRVEEIDMKMQQVETILAEQEFFESTYVYFYSQIPPEVEIDNFSLTDGTVTAEGTSVTIDPIREFYETLIEQKKFAIVDLTSVKKEEDYFSFSLHLSEFTP